jgi:molecular chaperone GrpE
MTIIDNETDIQNNNIENQELNKNTEHECEFKQQFMELQVQHMRVLADIQNERRRMEKDKIDTKKYLISQIALPFLNQIDNLERAILMKKSNESDPFVEGITTVVLNLQKDLEHLQIVPFISVWTLVDPQKHEVMLQSPGEEWVILSEFQKGYMFGEWVLRHAKVVVGTSV